MPKLTINNNEIEVENGLTVMQACTQAGIEIPHFCFHKKLKIAGNCRMCLVEMERSPKPIASCAMQVSEGMVIHTDTPLVKNAREGVMEFLLINHPLDCPICDQGGECDLQDQAFKYGKGKNRYHENKRAVKDKNLGPLVKTHMTRCIHCTRCIRFATDVAGVPEIGAINRGENMEIVSYLEKTLTSEMSGNIIDLCPVGALTSKPYAFKARNWEMQKTASIDVMDAMGSNIRVDSRGGEVMRILPRENEQINEEWISDKARFSYDGLRVQRLDTPYIRRNDKLEKASWEQALEFIKDKFSKIEKDKIAAIAGTTASCESMFALKKLLSLIGSNKIDANQFGYKLDTSSRGNYLFNTTIANIEKADLCLMIGANPKQVAPVLNSRIGRMVREATMQVARIGEQDDQTYPIQELGADINILQDILKGNHEFANQLKNAKYPMLIMGDAALSRSDSMAIISLVHEIVEKYQLMRTDWQGFNILHNHASIVGALDLGFVYGKAGCGTADILNMTQNNEVQMLYLLAADDIDIRNIGKDCFVVYQGHHGDASANRADVILPEAAYTEQDGMFVNLEGRVQYAKAAVSPLGKAKQSSDIIIQLANQLQYSLEMNNLKDIRRIIAEENKIFDNINQIIPSDFVQFRSDIALSDEKLSKIKINYYMTDSISKASVTMAKCAKALMLESDQV